MKDWHQLFWSGCEDRSEVDKVNPDGKMAKIRFG